MDVVEYPHKQLRAEAFYYAMIYAPMTCLALNRLLESLTVGRETSIQTNTLFEIIFKSRTAFVVF